MPVVRSLGTMLGQGRPAPPGLLHFLHEIPNYSMQKFGNQQQGQTTLGATFVLLHAVKVPVTVTISGIRVFHGAVAAGNLRVGLYLAGAGNLPDGAALLGESAVAACNGVTRAQDLAFTIGNLQLAPGLYWAALQADNVLDTYGWMGRLPNEIAGSHFDYARSYNIGAFVAFTDPCPATVTDAFAFMMYLVVVRIP